MWIAPWWDLTEHEQDFIVHVVDLEMNKATSLSLKTPASGTPFTFVFLS